jgi:hypothetical protein
LKAAKHADMAKLAKAALKISASPKTIEDAFAIAKEVVDGSGQRFATLKTAYALLGLDPRQWNVALNRWKQSGGPPLPEHAPYHRALSTKRNTDAAGDKSRGMRADTCKLQKSPVCTES